MPWAIISQTIPIVAHGADDRGAVESRCWAMHGARSLPKAIIAAYLSFFPVLVGMVKGLRSPDAMQLDLLRTYNASAGRRSGSCGCPPSMPYLFA